MAKPAPKQTRGGFFNIKKDKNKVGIMTNDPPASTISEDYIANQSPDRKLHLVKTKSVSSNNNNSASMGATVTAVGSSKTKDSQRIVPFQAIQVEE